MALYLSIPHDEGLKVLWKQYDKFIDKTVLTEDIIKWAEFVLKSNLFEFNSKFYKQISGIAIATKFAPPYDSSFMNYIKTELLTSQLFFVIDSSMILFHMDRCRGKSC